MSDEMEVRPIQEHEMEEFLRILEAAFEPHRMDYTKEAYKATIRPDIDAKEVYVAVADGSIIGVGALEESGDAFHLSNFAVSPFYQGRGLSKAFLERLFDIARERGAKRMSLECSEPLVRAIGFYEIAGFKRTGKVRDMHGSMVFEMVKGL